MTRKFTHIIVHCSAGSDHETFDWDQIFDWHVIQKGWDYVGYHFGVEQVDGEFYTMVGRPLTREGAHCRAEHMNPRALGICVVGNFDMIEPEPALYRYLADRLIAPLMDVYGIPLNNVLLHRDVENKKTCPGMNFIKSDLHQAIKEVLHAD